ncbi:MAG TPA: prolyl oligopeptidase family serine peptidase [Dermatophilaceae bacterium]|nr:prolyl oligopeptidase family serine peptidase [Dermatophilaceae bacterium]
MNRQLLLRRTAIASAATSAGLATVSAAGSLGAATYFARKVLTPDPRRPDDTQIWAVDHDTVMVAATPDSVLPGRYGLWLDGGQGHARVGDIVDSDGQRVRRRLLGVDRGRLTVGFARWNQYYYGADPATALGLATQDVRFASDVGQLPAWRVDAGAGRRWAVLVHGRGARREECLRALPVLHQLGVTSLVPSYRNDIGAPASPDGRYSLGLSEWRDLEAAMRYAVEQGADELILFGWSMGGAIVLQTLDRSWLAEAVTAVVLDAPVVDWGDVLRYHGALNHIPPPIATLTSSLLGRRWSRRLVGVHEPIDVASTNWDDRAEELRHPVLLIHSEDDEFVPSGPSARLAAKRPDLVRWEPWRLARHTKEWNVDSDRWERVVRTFLAG